MLLVRITLMEEKRVIYCAGAEYSEDLRLLRTAPILQWLRRCTLYEVEEFCERNDEYEFETIYIEERRQRAWTTSSTSAKQEHCCGRIAQHRQAKRPT